MKKSYGVLTYPPDLHTVGSAFRWMYHTLNAGISVLPQFLALPLAL